MQKNQENGTVLNGQQDKQEFVHVNGINLGDMLSDHTFKLLTTVQTSTVAKNCDEIDIANNKNN